MSNSFLFRGYCLLAEAIDDGFYRYYRLCVSLSIYFESPPTVICRAVNIDVLSTVSMKTGQITCYKGRTDHKLATILNGFFQMDFS
jgi:hypothetical protein